MTATATAEPRLAMLLDGGPHHGHVVAVTGPRHPAVLSLLGGHYRMAGAANLGRPASKLYRWVPDAPTPPPSAA